jgi:hypothetical protein
MIIYSRDNKACMTSVNISFRKKIKSAVSSIKMSKKKID